MLLYNRKENMSIVRNVKTKVEIYVKIANFDIQFDFC